MKNPFSKLAAIFALTHQHHTTPVHALPNPQPEPVRRSFKTVDPVEFFVINDINNGDQRYSLVAYAAAYRRILREKGAVYTSSEASIRELVNEVLSIVASITPEEISRVRTGDVDAEQAVLDAMPLQQLSSTTQPA